jgi:FixJ family two-component response regulator
MEDDQVPTVNETLQGEFSENGFTTLKLDVATILENLTLRQRVICQHLIHDKMPRQIQKLVQCSQSTLATELDKIRRRFRAFDYC